MSSKAIALFLALASAPAIAAAQSASPLAPPPATATAAPPAPPHAPFSRAEMRAHMQAFRQFHDQVERLHDSARAKILGALSAAHRALLARVVGNLAVSAHPDRRIAARELDAALTAHERQAILNESRYVMEQTRALMNRMRSQMMSTMGSAQRHRVVMMHGGMRHYGHHHRAPDAGEILLQFATNEHPPMMQFMVVHHPR